MACPVQLLPSACVGHQSAAPGAGADVLGDAEIEDLGPSLMQHDVARFQVSMHDLPLVGEFQRIQDRYADLVEEVIRSVLRELLLGLTQVRINPAVDQERVTGVLADAAVKELSDVLVFKSRNV